MPTLTKIGRNTIHDSAVSTAQLEDGSVAVADIGTNAVGNDELINSESYTVNGLTATGNAQVNGTSTVNGTTLSKGAVTVGDSSANTNFTIPTARGTQDQVLKYPASGTTLTWGNISVSGYNGVAWFYKVESAQTIPVNKAIVVPGPLEIASGGTVTVQGRLHVI
tara:strand:+ start:9 stop:503 length:495 start_codon:yes stop_codon:yes gene_type:complete